LKIFTPAAEGGTASDLETSRAEAALADAQAATPSILEQIHDRKSALHFWGAFPGRLRGRMAL
jgi:hypothetical protein